MNWGDLSAWVYQDSIPDTAKAKAHGIAAVFIDPRSSNAEAQIAAIRAAGLTPGIYTSLSWGPPDPTSFAKWTSDALNHFLPRNGAPVAAPYMADLETTDVRWVETFLSTYRKYQPQRPSAYTNAPFQGGYVPAAALVAARFEVFIQVYYGDMSAADGSAALLEQARHGVPAANLHPFYDGAALPRDARDGCVFTLERLP